MAIERVTAVSAARTWMVQADMPDQQDRVDRVALADKSKAQGSREAARHGVAYDQSAAAADERARAQAKDKELEEHRMEVRDAREAAMRRESFDVDV